jgi:hypothetical protein
MAEYNAANERHIAIQRRVVKALDESHDVFINTIMGMVDGRAYVHDLLIYCNVFGQPFSADALFTAYGCGKLDVGQVILRRIHAICPDQYVQMMREANARDIANDTRRSRSDADANGRDRGPEPYRHPSADGDDSPAAADADYNPVEVGLPGSIDDPEGFR